MTIAGSSSTLANYTRLILLAVASTTPVGRYDFSVAALCDTVDTLNNWPYTVVGSVQSPPYCTNRPAAYSVAGTSLFRTVPMPLPLRSPVVPAFVRLL